MTSNNTSSQEQKLQTELKCKEMNIKLCEWALSIGITTFTSGINVQEKLDNNVRECREIKDRLATLHIDRMIIDAAKRSVHNS